MFLLVSLYIETLAESCVFLSSSQIPPHMAAPIRQSSDSIKPQSRSLRLAKQRRARLARYPTCSSGVPCLCSDRHAPAYTGEQLDCYDALLWWNGPAA